MYVDAVLSGVQQRNLEAAWGCLVLDRVGLIIGIFGQRARTREAKVQVNLEVPTPGPKPPYPAPFSTYILPYQ